MRNLDELDYSMNTEKCILQKNNNSEPTAPSPCHRACPACRLLPPLLSKRPAGLGRDSIQPARRSRRHPAMPTLRIANRSPEAFIPPRSPPHPDAHIPPRRVLCPALNQTNASRMPCIPEVEVEEDAGANDAKGAPNGVGSKGTHTTAQPPARRCMLRQVVTSSCRRN